MGTILRPLKAGGNRRYTDEVAAGHTDIIDTEIDGDLDTVYTLVNGNLEDANIKAGAGIVRSKLSLGTDWIVNADVNSAAAIAKSKLAALDIVNADVNGAAAIARSKLNFGSGLVDADIAAAAAIAWSKIAHPSTFPPDAGSMGGRLNALVISGAFTPYSYGGAGESFMQEVIYTSTGGFGLAIAFMAVSVANLGALGSVGQNVRAGGTSGALDGTIVAQDYFDVYAASSTVLYGALVSVAPLALAAGAHYIKHTFHQVSASNQTNVNAGKLITLAFT
jgi:hypothetical protein